MNRKTRSAAACFLLVLLVFAGVPAAKGESGQEILIQYVTQETAFQPLLVRADASIDTEHPNQYFYEWGGVSAELESAISSRLTDGREIVDIDVSPARIAMLLAEEQHVFLRAAVWDAALNDYVKTDTAPLTKISYMDTLHDTDAIFLIVPNEESPMEETWLTFQCVMGEWLLTDATDTQTYYAKREDASFVFTDYTDGDRAYEWKTEASFPVEGFSASAFVALISQYDAAMPDRPSLAE